MATEEKQDKLEEATPESAPKVEETKPESAPKVEETTPPKEEKSEEKPVYKFPHQVLMEKLGKKDADVDANTKEYISDFNDFLKHVKMTKASAEKKGQKWSLPETKKNKLLRLSKSVCQSLQVIIDEEEDKKRAIQEAKELEARRREFLIQKRREQKEKMKAKIEAEEQRLKKEEEEEEDDTLGFWF